MKIGFILLIFSYCWAYADCKGRGYIDVSTTQSKQKSRPASIGIIGDTSDIATPTTGGTVLMGGGNDVNQAFQWMIRKSGGGDVVVIRAAGTDAYNPYINALGKVNSVETLKIDSRELADNDTVISIIKNAELLFIAGGDQSNYMKYWKGTKTADAINYLMNEKKVPVGGTSAGCAILCGYYFSGEKGSITSTEALADPYNAAVTLYKQDFLHPPFLENVITDQHYLTRNREGRHIAFISRIKKDWNGKLTGIAVDEKTALCIDNNGYATVFGSSYAFIIKPNNGNIEVCEKNQRLTWINGEKALAVYQIKGKDSGAGEIKLAAKSMKDKKSEGKWLYWWVDQGIFKASHEN
ncbi:type 1 glutamine amidotransferase-like domain-containing protein [Pedobacter sp. HMF7647]|uniref:Type 1 glutamine amidotransferase-like domain-containing protein n=1 Tax=Hufsiella arboris TaxID=2695275 RepID=A0A7K1YBB4_9SPHI|nr:cyanophycinase [Hufsiella arboris]MXV51651.1 type 1 glutamine amidotransferase-like domain-containing protein [Hufsiella arboris]